MFSCVNTEFDNSGRLPIKIICKCHGLLISLENINITVVDDYMVRYEHHTSFTGDLSSETMIKHNIFDF